MNRKMKRILVAATLVGFTHTCLGLEAWDTTKAYANKAMVWKTKSLKSLSFKSVFPKPLYKKSYFGAVLTGATIIGAGAVTYFTAGAGAPAAATGVSSVASWVAGGGAGSYMAGLSTVGGWFGGNAMLGSAILNGISIGVTGGGAAFATLPAIGKAGVMASVTATALDGIALVQKPDTKNLSYRIRLTVPHKLGSKPVRQLSKQLDEVETEILEAAKDNQQKAFKELTGKKDRLNKKAIALARAALKNRKSNEDRMVLGIIAKNAGRSDLFEKLVNKIPSDKMEDAGYIDYLKAVAHIERGDTDEATKLLQRSWRLNPYAVEQPLLLISILGRNGFESREKEIRTIVEKANNDFDSDKYEASYSLVSLNYRLGTMYFSHKKYGLAQRSYEKAYDELSLAQKHLGSKSMKQTIRLGIANALYAQDRMDEAQELIGDVLADAETDAERTILKSQYVGNI